jgi:hypothetical protein
VLFAVVRRYRPPARIGILHDFFTRMMENYEEIALAHAWGGDGKSLFVGIATALEDRSGGGC